MSEWTYASSGITLHGKIVDSTDNPLVAPTAQFRIRIKSPGVENCLLWEETQIRPMAPADNGVFTLTVGDQSLAVPTVRTQTSITNSVTTLPFQLAEVFANGVNYTGLSCASGSSYNALSQHGRIVEMSFSEVANSGVWEDVPSMKVNYVPLAYQAEKLGNRNTDEFLKIASYPSQTVLSNTQVDTLLGLVNGTATNYLRPSDNFAGDVTGPSNATVVSRIRGTNVVATAPTTGQVLKFDGTNWVPSADAVGSAVGDASYAAKGVVQGLTDEATSGLRLAAGVLSLGDVGAAGTYGSSSQIPVITTDAKGRVTGVVNTAVNDSSKLPLAGGTMTGPINMGNQNITNINSVAATNFSGRNLVLNDNDTNTVTIRTPTDIVANYALTLPINDGDAGEVLTTDGAGVLSWSAAGAGGDITEVVAGTGLTGGATSGVATLNVNVGTGINQIPQNSTALGAGDVIVANATGTALTSLNCGLNQIIKFDGAGIAGCGTDDGGAGATTIDGLTDAATDYATTYNMYLGSGVGATTTTGTQNTSVGALSLQAVTTGANNAGFGALSLQSLTTGGNNAAFGREALNRSTTGSRNTAVGNASMYQNIDGGDNVAVGELSLVNSVSGSANVALGRASLSSLGNGGNNTAIGTASGDNATGLSDGNIFLGYLSGPSAPGVISNQLYIHNAAGNPTIFGDLTNRRVGLGGMTNPSTTLDVNGAVNVREMATPAVSPTDQGRIYFDSTSNKFRVSENGGAYVDLVGAGGASTIDALSDAAANYTNNSLYLGQGAGNGSAAIRNTGVGSQVMQSLTTGVDNTAVGNQALQSVTTGGTNTAVGPEALLSLTTGNANTAIGSGSLVNVTNGTGNTALGSATLTFLQSSSGNTAIGRLSLYRAEGGNNTALGVSAGESLQTGDSNIYLGHSAGPVTFPATESNRLYIHNASGDPTIFGDLTNRRVGLGGMTNPSTTLDINGAVTMREIAAPAVSPADQGRIYFDSTSNKFRVSENGGAYVDLVGAGGGSGGTYLADDGSDLAPSYSFTNDPNTGFYSGADDVLMMTIGGSDAAQFNNGVFDYYRSQRVYPGSATDPSYGLGANSSVGTGMFAPATNTIGFSTNNSERMRISANGNVGIGTGNPNHKFEVYTNPFDANSGEAITSNTSTFMNNPSNSTALVTGSRNGLTLDLIANNNVVTTSWNDMTIGSGSATVDVVRNSFNRINHTGAGTVNNAFGVAAEILKPGAGVINNAYGLYTGTIEGTNKFSIYTTDATAPVSIASAIDQRGIASAPAVSATDQGRIYFDSTSNKFRVSENGGAYVDLVSSGGGSGDILNNGNTTGSAVTIGTNDNFALNLETNNSSRMTILNNGNVGIGTASPNTLLTVAGRAGVGVDAAGYDSQATFNVQSFTSGASSPWMAINSSDSMLSLSTDNSVDGSFIGYQMGDLTFKSQTALVYGNPSTNGTPRMTLTADGNLGIGTTAPGTILDINGAFSQRGIAAPAVSPVGQGRIYFDSTSNKFRISENGAAYSDILTSMSGFNANQAIVANGSGVASSFTCGVGQVLGFDASGFAVCTSSGSSSIDGLSDGVADYTTSFNFFLGSGVGSSSTGVQNLAIGPLSFQTNVNGVGNTAIGYMSLNSNVGRSESTAVGFQAMRYADSTASFQQTQSTALGAYALRGSTTAASNVGVRNTAIGHSSMMNITSGASNVAVGNQTLMTNSTGSFNTAVGRDALLNNTTGSANTAIGSDALDANTTGASNTAVGVNALNLNTTGIGNTAVGQASLRTLASGDANTAVGNTALRLLVTGTANTALGNNALLTATNASFNTAIGSNASIANTTGQNNAALGSDSLANNADGNNNTALGARALNLATGSNNIGVGYGAGDNLTTGSNNIIIGYDIDVVAATGSNQLNIGNAIYGNLSNGNIGIGTTSPSTAFDLNGAFTQREMAAPAVSPADQGRIYFDSTSNKFRVSENGGAYVDLVGAGGSGDILNNGNSFAGAATLGTNDNFALNFETNNTPRMTILPNGNVGIGTTNPGDEFVMSHAKDDDVIMRVLNTNPGTAAESLFVADIGGDRIAAYGHGGAGATGLSGIYQNRGFIYTAPASDGMVIVNHGADPILFATDAIERMRVDSIGNVGIGITNPNTVLDVNGAFSQRGIASPGVSPAGQGRIYFDSTSNKFRISENGAAYVDLVGGGGGSGDILNNGNATGSAVTIGTNDAFAFNFETSNTPRMTIDAAGQVSMTNNLEVGGQIVSPVVDNAASTTFNFDNGNMQYTSASCGAMTLQNMRDGGSYTLAVQGTTQGTCTFTHSSDTFLFSPANGLTVSGTETVYHFTKMGSKIYVTWVAGFQ